jgi:hypothetical protein
MADAPQFSIVPPLRCCEVVNSPYPEFCGELAVVRRPGSTYWFDEFFCRAHSTPADVPIADNQAFRRVHLVVDVYFAACSVSPAVAQTEAVGRLELAVRDAGGLVNVQAVRSTVGRDGLRRGHGKENGEWEVQR